MRVLVAHVRYRHPGGEDCVVEHEAALLRSAGVDVSMLAVESNTFDTLPLRARVAVALSQGAHEFGRSLMRDAIVEHRPDVVHAHNLFPLLGPASLQVASQMGCGTVATLHNYRLSCLAGTHLRNDELCEQCSLESRGPGIWHGCYRGSQLQSALYSRGVKALVAGIGEGLPDALICLTEFQRRRYVEQGLSAARLVVKPNSVDPGAGSAWQARKGVVFVGRLSAEKGVAPLVRAWESSAPPLTIIGNGPQAAEVADGARLKPNITIKGQLLGSEVRRELRAARVLVLPSLSYEGLPLTVLESLAESTPVIAFSGGALEGVLTGLVSRGDFTRLVSACRNMAEATEGEWNLHSAEALCLYNAHYTDERNSRALVELYRDLLQRREE